jgi:glucuronoarabinoxylan endo-1,4-beta-xylanase
MNKKIGVAAFISIILAAALVLAACELGSAEDPLKNLSRPFISVQPQSKSFATNAYTTPHILSVDIWDWDDKDGELTYQWYGFEDINIYCQNGSGTEISGATESSYTPNITATAGKKYYFYVVVTNTNKDAGDVTSASIQSEVATIAFSAPGDPLVPVISRNPADASYGWGRALNALKVEAKLQRASENVPAAGTLTYQWFSNTTYGVTGGTAVASEDKASFIPGYDTLKINKNYYYVVVTNTIGVKTATAVSLPVIVDMKPGLRAAAPRIDKQPVDRLYFNNDTTIKALEITAASPDMGALSYQWYWSDPPTTAQATLNSGGTIIAGATDKSFVPPKTPANRFYYVVVKNTNENVSSNEKTSEVASRAVQVRFANAGNQTANATVTIPSPTGANLKQYVRGYGGMHVAWDNFPRLDKEDTELMYNPDKMGYNILRIMIRPDNIDIKKTMDDMVNGKGRQFYADYYENVKIVNQYGGYVAASPWTPPKEWKSNNSINGGGNLIPGYYRLFANYLRTFAQLMYDNGAPIYCISISNEPNYVAGYDGCEWSPEEMRAFWLEIGHFTDGIRGYGGGKELPYVLTMNGESANTPFINRQTLGNPKSRAVVDLLARHIYGKRTESLYNTPSDYETLKRPDGTLTEVWMTEHNINSANATGYYNDSTWNYVWRYLNDVDLVMRINNENAFVWWASKRFYSMVGDGQFGATEHAPLPRGWALTHYSRYTIDTTRIDLPDGSITGTITNASGTTVDIGNIERGTSVINNTTDDMDNLSVRITAYVSQNGNEISMIIWTPTLVGGNSGYNLGTLQIKLPNGFLINGVKAHRSKITRMPAVGSTAAYDRYDMFLPDDDTVISADRTSAFVTVPRSQILSIKFTK